MSALRLARAVLAFFLLSHLVLALTWCVANVGDVPPYGDTEEYLTLARTLRVDAYRGVIYAWLIAILDGVHGGASYLSDVEAWTRSSAYRAPPGLRIVQLFQLVFGAAALVYFLARMVRPLPTASRTAGALLAALVLLDPLVAHFHASVMPDGLALAASLAFLAALADLGLRRGPAWVSGIVLFATQIFASGLRAEKEYVLLGTVAVTVLAWSWLGRRRPRGERPRVVAPLVITALAIAVNAGIAQAAQHELGRWSIRTTILHQRVIFPHLRSVWDELPPRVQSRIPLEEAERYDENINHARVVMVRAASGDRNQLEALTEAIYPVVLRRHWQGIALDTFKDALENVVATGSYYTRLGVIAYGGSALFRDIFHSDGAYWTYSRLIHQHPDLSRLYLASGAAITLLAVLIALADLRLPSRGGSPVLGWAAWIPVLAFAVLNGAAFAVTMDMVHVRYVLLAHVAFLVLVFRSAIGRAWP